MYSTNSKAILAKLSGSVLLFLFTLSACGPKEETTPWVSLFDGKTLDGWHRENGEAEYSVEDGMIVGKAMRNTPNTFLCSDSVYSDFILEFTAE
jgi:hypothetical protein